MRHLALLSLSWITDLACEGNTALYPLRRHYRFLKKNSGAWSLFFLAAGRRENHGTCFIGYPSFFPLSNWNVGLPNSKNCCLFSGFRSEADEIYAVLGNYVAYGGNVFPTFRDNLSFQSSKVKMGPRTCPETPARNYHPTLDNFAEDHRSKERLLFFVILKISVRWSVWNYVI
jgi:hypothetical protein